MIRVMIGRPIFGENTKWAFLRDKIDVNGDGDADRDAAIAAEFD